MTMRGRTVDRIVRTPVNNVSIDFHGGRISTSLDEEISEPNIRLIQVACERNNRRDRGYYIIKESLPLIDRQSYIDG